MKRLKKHLIVKTLLENAILPIFYSNDSGIAKSMLKACFEGGLLAVEFVDRGENSIHVFREMIQYRNNHFPNMFIGAGTIYDQHMALSFLSEGADFIVSPMFNKEIAFICNQRKVLWIPGCGTMKEIVEAESYGAEIIKIFPAASLGYSFVKNVLGPSPSSCLMVSGE